MNILVIGIVILQVALRIYIAVLWARFILDTIRLLQPNLSVGRALALIFETIYSLTDPPIKLVRKFLPPLRIGNIALDLGWLVTLVTCQLLITLLGLAIQNVPGV